MNIRIISTFCLIAATGFFAPGAHCDPPTHEEPLSKPVILFVSLARCCPEQYWAEGEHTLQEELQTLDVSTRMLYPETGHFDSGRSFFTSLQQYHHADVVLRVFQRNNTALQADILLRQSGEPGSFRQMHFATAPDNDPMSTVNLRIIEAVRAGLLRTNASVPPPATPVRDTGIPQPANEIIRMRVGATLLQGPGKDALCGGPHLSLGLVIMKQLMLEANTSFGAACSAITRNGTTASFTPLLIRGFVLWAPGIQGRIRPEAGIGAGVIRAWSTGQSSNTAANTTDADNVAWTGGTIRMTVRLTPMTGLVLGGTMGTTIPAVQVVFNDSTVAEWGHPLLEGHLSLEMRFR